MLRASSIAAAGMAATGFLIGLLGAIHLLNPTAAIVAYAALVAACARARGERVFAATFWQSRLAQLRRSWNGSLLLAYYAALALAMPAVIGNIAGSDPVAYHLVYPKEWAVSGSITVDPFLRLPFYANNFLLFFAALMSAGGDVFVNYIVLATLILGALGACSYAGSVLERRFPWYIANPAALLLGLSIVVAPASLRWATTAYIDVPIGVFALFALLCACLAIQSRRAAWLCAAALCAAFLVGMKGSFILLLPVYALGIWIAGKYASCSRRTVWGALALFVVLASPWYVRNLALAGDPTPPAFNIALHGRDGLMTKGEWQLNQQDLRTEKSASAIIKLPLRAFFTPQELREYGTTGLILFLYAIPALLLVRFAAGKRIDGESAVALFLVIASFAYWAVTSAWLRYESVFFFALPALVSLGLAQLPRKAGSAMVLAAAILAIWPSPGSRPFYVQSYYRNFRYLPESYQSDSALASYTDNYREAEDAAAIYHSAGLKGNVYMLGGRVGYYFLEHGITAIGDWMGPAGWFRLYRAVDAGEAADFLKILNVQEVLIRDDNVVGGLRIPLETQLTAAGFCRVPLNSPTNDLFIAATGPQQERACRQPIEATANIASSK